MAFLVFGLSFTLQANISRNLLSNTILVTYLHASCEIFLTYKDIKICVRIISTYIFVCKHDNILFSVIV